MLKKIRNKTASLNTAIPGIAILASLFIVSYSLASDYGYKERDQTINQEEDKESSQTRGPSYSSSSGENNEFCVMGIPARMHIKYRHLLWSNNENTICEDGCLVNAEVWILITDDFIKILNKTYDTQGGVLEYKYLQYDTKSRDITQAVSFHLNGEQKCDLKNTNLSDYQDFFRYFQVKENRWNDYSIKHPGAWVLESNLGLMFRLFDKKYAGDLLSVTKDVNGMPCTLSKPSTQGRFKDQSCISKKYCIDLERIYTEDDRILDAEGTATVKKGQKNYEVISVDSIFDERILNIPDNCNPGQGYL